jgi:hypothetical protein
LLHGNFKSFESRFFQYPLSLAHLHLVLGRVSPRAIRAPKCVLLSVQKKRHKFDYME